MVTTLSKPWLVAAWPGMGGVAQIAGRHLAQQLGAEATDAFDPPGFFEPAAIQVREGLILARAKPRCVFHAWRNPRGGRDLLIALADEQPKINTYSYARALLERAARFGVERVFTFAALGTPIRPGAEPRTFAAGTSESVVAELKRDGVVLLEGGEIAGLNGVFLAAAAERGLPGACLLGEFPYYAAAVPNPRASNAVLRAFSRLSGVEVDSAELLDEAGRIEGALLEHLEALERAAAQRAESQSAEMEPSAEAPDSEVGPSEGTARATRARPKPPAVPPETLARIEELFAAAAQDRSKALELKSELDRTGLFERFEDRFLDLFKQAG